MQVQGIGVYLKAVYCKTGGKLQGRYIKIAHTECQHTFKTDTKNAGFCISYSQDNRPTQVSFKN
jgi:hypothetical protein